MHALKHELKRMIRRNEHPEECKALAEQLQDLTVQHGYGKLPLTGVTLPPWGMRYAPTYDSNDCMRMAKVSYTLSKYNLLPDNITTIAQFLGVHMMDQCFVKNSNHIK